MEGLKLPQDALSLPLTPSLDLEAVYVPFQQQPLMLSFRFSIFLVAGILLVAAGDLPESAPPEILASSGGSGTALIPYVGSPVRTEDAVDDTKVIRGLLTRNVKRQSCPGGYGLCNDGG